MDIEGPILHHLERPGDTVQLRAIASFSDATRPDVTNDAVWTVVDPRVLTVSRGLVTGVTDGGTIVTASYRGWSNVTNVQVGRTGLFAVFPVSGIVRDADTGAPLAGAVLTAGGSENERVLATTDGNGFFNLGEIGGFLAFGVARFGYANAGVALPAVREATTLDVRLTPNPGSYIERTVSGTFQSSTSTLRINTSVGGVFDAVLRAPTCAPGVSVRITAENGGASFGTAPTASCSARLRFVVLSPDIALTLTGTGTSAWELTYREPR